MHDERIMKGVYRSNVCGSVERGNPRRTFTDKLSDILKKRAVWKASITNGNKCSDRCIDKTEKECQNRS